MKRINTIQSNRDGSTTSLVEFRDLLVHLSGGWWHARRDDIRGREIICTPYDGNYGLAGWVIVVNGSPPRCTVLYEIGSERPVSVVAGVSRRMGLQQAAVSDRFWSNWLQGRTTPVIIAGEQEVFA